jgi:hypothetical protein
VLKLVWTGTPSEGGTSALSLVDAPLAQYLGASAFSPSCHFAATQQSGCFQSKADVAGADCKIVSIAKDPSETWPPAKSFHVLNSHLPLPACIFYGPTPGLSIDDTRLLTRKQGPIQVFGKQPSVNLRSAASSAIIRTSEHFHVFSPPPRLSVRMFGSGGKKRANASSKCAAL